MRVKITLLAIALTFASLSFGQLNFGFKVGITESKVKRTLSDATQTEDFRTGVQAGAFLDLRLLKNLNLRPGLQLTEKGYISSFGQVDGFYYWHRNQSSSYLELPVDLVYDVPLSNSTSLFIGAGPVLGFGLFGHSKSTLKIRDENGEMHADELSDTDPFNKTGLKRVDLGVDFLAGIRLNKFMLNAGYNHGLLNALNYDEGTQSMRNRSFAITLGYMLHK